MSTPTSLLQEVLRPQALGVDRLNSKHTSAPLSRGSSPLAAPDDSDDELVGVSSIPGSPSRSGAPSRQSSRPSSPTRMGASKRPVPGPLLITKQTGSSTDPLRAFPTEVSQRIFGHLFIRDLARCARVCKKWEKSQTLNYVWFQQCRKDQFHDETLPPGKWTRRESKQSWRRTFMQTLSQRERDLSVTNYVSPARSSRSASPFSNTLSFANIMSSGDSYPSSGYNSGYVTPREAREEEWRQEATEKERPSKVEMRGMYKELGGRKAREKGKFGGQTRDKGGWTDSALEDGL
ncbi:hypothetical protein EW145_g3277 [Phellinidium pouzarii]|uniref:F-box domain-containing protein n=1 Tax=Phellinidium pouzarii TaxID=167371 RepID=A0A4S4L7L4_9AGAM|nr:hypothetical protein EW145_g3277 [Phellinidium pouzarii]